VNLYEQMMVPLQRLWRKEMERAIWEHILLPLQKAVLGKIRYEPVAMPEPDLKPFVPHPDDPLPSVSKMLHEYTEAQPPEYKMPGEGWADYVMRKTSEDMDCGIIRTINRITQPPSPALKHFQGEAYRVLRRGSKRKAK
jgi:hypothetical protein